MNNGTNIPDVEPGIPPQTPNNAVSVYGQNDAMDDFPVLKAFQQYVDAEQAKAQKRMTTLCVFFSIILAIVVGVFVMLIMSMSNAKNDANEKLIQLMMQDRERHQNVVVQTPQPPAQSEAAIKALTDTVTSLQKQLADQQIKMIEEKQKAAEEAVKRAQAAAAQAAKPPSDDQLAQEKKNQSDLDRLAKAAADLKKQKEELANEKEKLRQREIEFQRRRLYPEYYENPAEKGVSGEKPTRNNTGKAYLQSLDDDEEDEESLDEILGTTDVGASPSPKKPAASPSRRPQPAVTKPVKLQDGSLRYFDDDDDEEEEDVIPPPAAATRPTVVPVRPIEKKPPKPVKAPSAAAAHDALLKGDSATAGWSIPLE